MTGAEAEGPVCWLPEMVGSLGYCQRLGPMVCSAMQGAIITSSGGFSEFRRRPEWQRAAVRRGIESAGCAPCDLRGRGSSSSSSFGSSSGVGFNGTARGAAHMAVGLDKRVLQSVRNGRGVPDVSAPGHFFPIIMNGKAMHVDGTSASAPVIAAMMTLFNDVRLRAGQPPLGMVAPLLYKLFERSQQTFSDVVVGNNGATHEKPCPSGYIAAVGWDAAT